jgi:hypothetical protein
MEDNIKRGIYKKIRCITGDSINLTKNKVYETYQESEKFYWIKENDNGASSFYKKEWFEEETIAAICINDKTTRDKKVKVLGITEGKEYQVKPSKYANYYELVNDLGNIETYFMDRFETKEKLIMECKGIKMWTNGRIEISIRKEENNKTWFQEAMEQVQPKVREQLQKAINNYFEGDKMEGKTIKVRCKWSDGTLELEKIYPVINDAINGYAIKGDDDKIHIYAKDMFEKVEDVFMVECIENLKNPLGKGLNLTVGKKYKVIENGSEEYLIENDKGNKNSWYLKKFFKPVESQKEVKEMDFKTVVADIKPNEEYICQDNYIIRCHENGRIEFEAPSGNKIWFDKEDIFEKIEPKPVTTTEAFKALDEGRTIKSVFSGYKYKKENGSIKYVNCSSDYSRNLSFQELEGQWIIKGDK